MIIFTIIVVALILFAFFVGMAIGWHKAENAKPKPYVPPVTYTVLGWGNTKIVDRMDVPKSQRVFQRYETRIFLVSSKGELQTKEFHAWLSEAQVKRIALESNWFYDDDVVEKVVLGA